MYRTLGATSAIAVLLWHSMAPAQVPVNAREAAMRDICGSLRPTTPARLVRFEGEPVYEMSPDGSLAVAAGRASEITFRLPESRPTLIARISTSEGLLSCQSLAASPPPNSRRRNVRDYRLELDHPRPDDRVAIIELFRAGPADPNAHADEAFKRAKGYLDAILLFDPAYGENVGVLLAAAAEANDAARAGTIVRAARARAVTFAQGWDTGNSLQTFRTRLQNHQGARLASLDAIAAQIAADPWSAHRRAEGLPKPGRVSKAAEILRWYSETPVAFRAVPYQRHRLPLRSVGFHNRARPSRSPVVRRAVRFGDRDIDSSVDRARRRLALVVTEVPRGITPGFRENATEMPHPDPAATLTQIAVNLGAGLSGGGPKMRVMASAAPVVATRRRVEVDRGLTLQARYESHTRITRVIQRGTEVTVRVCQSDPCPSSDGDTKIRNTVEVDGDRVAEVVALATVGVGWYPTEDRLQLRRLGDGSPDQLYRVEADDDRFPVLLTLGVGVRLGPMLLSASLAMVGTDLSPFRTWLFGLGFRVRTFSRYAYLQLQAGFSRSRVFRDVSRGDVVAFPSDDEPELETRRERIPLLGVTVTIDLAGAGSAATALVKRAGGGS